jgi:hypothetical protein
MWGSKLFWLLAGTVGIGVFVLFATVAASHLRGRCGRCLQPVAGLEGGRLPESGSLPLILAAISAMAALVSAAVAIVLMLHG